MKCVNCGNKFHYCSSCGHIPEAELNCCSEKCIFEYINIADGEVLIELLIEYLKRELYMNKDIHQLILNKVEQHKDLVAIRLLERVIEDF